MAVDAVQEVVDLLNDVTNGINYDNIANTQGTDLYISGIYENTKLDYINTDNIQVYQIDGTQNDGDYYNRSKYHKYTKLAVQIITRERNNVSGALPAGLYPLLEEVTRVLEVHRDWLEVDPTAKFHHMYILRDKDLSDKRNNFSKGVIDLELINIGVCRSN